MEWIESLNKKMDWIIYAHLIVDIDAISFQKICKPQKSSTYKNSYACNINKPEQNYKQKRKSLKKNTLHWLVFGGCWSQREK